MHEVAEKFTEFMFETGYLEQKDRYKWLRWHACVCISLYAPTHVLQQVKFLKNSSLSYKLNNSDNNYHGNSQAYKMHTNTLQCTTSVWICLFKASMKTAGCNNTSLICEILHKGRVEQVSE